MHKQSSLNHRRDEEVQVPADSDLYSPKSEKPKSLPKPMHYVLKEQRWLFVLVGMLIASTIFILQSSLAKRDTRKNIGGAEKFLSSRVGNSGVQKTTIVSRIVGGVKRQPLRIVVTRG